MVSVCTPRCPAPPASASGWSSLCHCITRPAPVNELARRNNAGQVVLRLKETPWRDGTTGIVMSPLGSMQRFLKDTVERPAPGAASSSDKGNQSTKAGCASARSASRLVITVGAWPHRDTRWDPDGIGRVW